MAAPESGDTATGASSDGFGVVVIRLRGGRGGRGPESGSLVELERPREFTGRQQRWPKERGAVGSMNLWSLVVSLHVTVVARQKSRPRIGSIGHNDEVRDRNVSRLLCPLLTPVSRGLHNLTSRFA